MYDYKESIKADVKAWIAENINLRDYSRDELEEHLNDTLFTEDAVTGNASGSYTFNAYEARDYVTDDGAQYVSDMCADFGITAQEVWQRFIDEDWEWFDVSIRCYLLPQVIAKVLDEYFTE